MGKTFESIGDDLAEWIRAQRVFFVATAPLSNEGHVNCSPKGGDCLRILDANRVAYLDLTGSGAETIAHVRENGRIVIMFCAFEGPPKIVRLYGTGRALIPGDAEFSALEGLFPKHVGTRAIIVIDLNRIADSCGFSVPFMDFVSHRPVLDEYCEKLGPEKLVDYRRRKNQTSIDGLPALKVD